MNMNNLQREPAVVVAVLQAALAVAVSFGLDLSAEQVSALLAFAAAIGALVVRQRVTPIPMPALAPTPTPAPTAATTATLEEPAVEEPAVTG